MTVTHRNDVEGVSSPSVLTLGSPSLVPTILVTIFFGVFGLIPAVRHSKMARERGYKGAKYWTAFGVSLAGAFAIGILIILGLGAVLSTSLTTPNTTAPSLSQAANSTPTTSAASVSPVAPVGNASSLNLPAESASDSPATVVNNLDGPDGIYVRMLQSDNPDYLVPYYYASTNASGYASVMSLLTQRVTIHQQVLSNLVAPPMTTDGSFTATFDIQDDTFPVAHYTVTYQWNPTVGVWNVESSTHTS